MLLQRPFQEVLKSGQPDFPFCLAWANHDWTTGTWMNGGGSQMIAEQRYLGDEDYILHFNYVLPAFRDHRYITVDGRPLFVIYDPYRIPDVGHFLQLWRSLAEKKGLPGIYFVAQTNNTSTIRRHDDGSVERVMPNLQSSADVFQPFLDLGFDGIISNGKARAEMLYLGKYRKVAERLLRDHLSWLPALKLDYPKVVRHFFAPEDTWENVFPIIMPQWDRSARTGRTDGIYVNATPEHFREHIEQALEVIKQKQPDHRILILRSWNEWAEGNYVEPDLLHGHGFLQAIRDAIQ